jgi:hypothetical protein
MFYSRKGLSESDFYARIAAPAGATRPNAGEGLNLYFEPEKFAARVAGRGAADRPGAGRGLAARGR